MRIKGYKFIAGKVVPRKWGTEYRFSVVSESTGKNYDDIVMINPKDDEKIIASKIESKLLALSTVIPEPEPEKVYTQKEIDNVLVEKKYFTSGKKFPGDLPTKVEAVTNGK